jgi:hypothetical protein
VAIKIQEFRVTGRGRFPLDMLRYDRAYPVHPDDVRIIEGASTDPDPVKVVVVTLRRWCESRRDQPTEGRWQSFGWPVVTGSVNALSI